MSFPPASDERFVATTERMMSKTAGVSVVIPTLGADSVRTTIEHLNAGSLPPDEILVCLPAQEAGRLSDLQVPNVKIVVTDCRGQVAQRAAGFGQVSHELVLQLDDDIVVDKTCLERLVHELNHSGPRCAVAPSMRWLANNEPVNRALAPPILSKVFYWILNGPAGARPGIVTKAGAEIGVYAVSTGRESTETEWIPGGCVLHRRDDLVVEDFFPFKGKAFCEDLIHSFLLRNRGVRLIVNHQAAVFLEGPSSSPMPLRHFLSALRDEFRARLYYVKLSSRSKARLYLYFFARLIKRVVK